MDLDESFMRLAIDRARDGIALGQTPFGACIVRNGEVVSCQHNVVWHAVDITAHAEIHAIRVACRRLDTVDISGCEIYSTCEPCPMCFAACHWARLSRIVFGASIADARRAGFHELPISNRTLKRLGRSPITVEGGCLRTESVALFDEWSRQPGHRPY